MGSCAPGTVLDLPYDVSAPAAARRHTREALDHWRLSELREPVFVIVSELVTNAVTHGTEPVWIQLTHERDALQIAVHDGTPHLKQPDEASHDAESGRGLQLVKAYATDFGIEHIFGDGKVAWAKVTC